MVIYTSPTAGTSENSEGRIFVDESDYRLIEEKLPFIAKDVVRIRAKEKFSKLYECFDIIGEGKFGKVYRCREKASGLELAAKRIKIKRDADRQQVEKEVAIMTQMRHPRIAQIYDAFSTPDNDIVLVMEVVPGGELFDRVVQENYILTELAVVMIISQLCEAVEYIHSKHIVHLDIKPENIMCVSQTSNRIKLIDFGLAQHYDGTSNLLFMAGTPEFVAPEVIKFEPIDFHTDMWSIGVITYILLSGISPFLGDSLGETYCAVEKGEWEFDEECFEGISDAAKDFISNLLVYDQKQRMLPEECLQHEWIVQARGRTSCQSPVCQPDEGKLISKASLRSYIKNQRFRRATWAVLFLMRFKKFGHINWRLINKLIDKDNKQLQKLPVIQEKLSEACTSVVCNVNVKTTNKLMTRKRKVNIEVFPVIERPTSLIEQQIKKIPSQENLRRNGVEKNKQISSQKVSKEGIRTSLSSYNVMAVQVTKPVQEHLKCSFNLCERKIRVKIARSSERRSTRNLMTLTVREKIRRRIRLKKPLIKTFHFNSPTHTQTASIVLKIRTKESAVFSIKIRKKAVKSLKTRSLIMPSDKSIGRSDLNNNAVASSNDRGEKLRRAVSLRRSKPKKLPETSSINEKESTTSQKSLNEIIIKQELQALGQRKDVAKLLEASIILTARSTAKISRTVNAEIVRKRRLQLNTSIVSQKLEQVTSKMQKNAVSVGNPLNSLFKDSICDKQPNVRKVLKGETTSAILTSVDTELEHKTKRMGMVFMQLGNGETSNILKSERSNFLQCADVTTNIEKQTRLKKRKSDLPASKANNMIDKKRSTETLEKRTVSSGQQNRASMSEITTKERRPLSETKQKANQNRGNALRDTNNEECQKTFKIASNKEQSCACSFSCNNTVNSVCTIQSKTISLKKRCKRKSLNEQQSTKSKETEAGASKHSSVNVVTGEKSDFPKRSDSLREQEKQRRKPATDGSKERKAIKKKNENIAHFRLSDGKCTEREVKKDVDTKPKRASEVQDEDYKPEPCFTNKEKGLSSFEWMKSKLQTSLKNRSNKGETSGDAKKAETSKVVNSAQNMINMWKMIEKTNKSTTNVESAKVVGVQD